MADPESVPAKSLLVSITDETGRPVRAGGLGRWLETAAPARARGQVSVALVPDQVMRGLNRRFAGINRVTDVLSFPADPAIRPKAGSGAVRRAPAGPGGRPLLGDIVIAVGRAARQARQAGHSVPMEWRVLALHGLLHLLGHDHHADGGTMARLERRLRRKAGLSEGLIERAGAS